MDKRSMKPVQRFLAVLLCLAMLLPMAMVPVHAEESTESTVSTTPATEAATEASDASESATLLSTDEEETPLAVVYAASDFQLKNSEVSSNSSDTGDAVDTAKENMKAIIDQMQAAGYSVDSALFCGDYSAYYNTWGTNKVNVTANNTGLATVAELLESEWKLTSYLNSERASNGGDDVVYVQGNHDPAETVGLDVSGKNDSTYYGVFVIHEDDFQWKQGATSGTGNSNNPETAAAAAQTTAANLEAYLKEKLDQKYDQPIFVVSHVPLH